MRAVLDPGLQDRLGMSIHLPNFKPSRKPTQIEVDVHMLRPSKFMHQNNAVLNSQAIMVCITTLYQTKKTVCQSTKQTFYCSKVRLS